MDVVGSIAVCLAAMGVATYFEGDRAVEIPSLIVACVAFVVFAAGLFGRVMSNGYHQPPWDAHP